MEVVKLSQKATNRALKVIASGGVVIFPTDTVYGFLSDATNEKAVEKIYKIKKREKQKPLGVFVKDVDAANTVAFVKKEHGKFLRDNKTTSVLKARKNVLSPLVYKDNAIGIRIPKYEFLNLILEKFGKPLAQTSANISGKPATTKIKEVLEQFKDKDVLIIDAGDLPKNTPSTIIDLTKNKIETIRE